MIEEAEAFLHGKGFVQVRVRVHGKVARIEVPKDEMHALLDMHAAVTGALRALGFSYVTLDLEGYRTGAWMKCSHLPAKDPDRSLPGDIYDGTDVQEPALHKNGRPDRKNRYP